MMSKTQNDGNSRDVFISYNSHDKKEVRELIRSVTTKGVTVWFDKDELRPGLLWSRVLQKAINTSKSVAVCVGRNGIGPWEEEEMHAALTLATKLGKPVIPVMLPGAGEKPELPLFLANRTWVELKDFSDSSIAPLLWGITGEKTKIANIPDEAASQVQRIEKGISVRCTLSCREDALSQLHARNSAFLAKLCSKFPHTEFSLSKADPNQNASALGRPVNLKILMEVMLGEFLHGENVVLEVTGELETIASTFLKIALENLDGYSDDPAGTAERINSLVDKAFDHLFEPDIDVPEEIVSLPKPEPMDTDNRFLAVINDRLHDVSLQMIPLVAKFYDCDLRLCFELPEKGIYFFHMGPNNNYILDPRILECDLQVGARITILTSGNRSHEAGQGIKHILDSLWQCDHWIRSNAKDWNVESGVPALLKYAEQMSKTSDPAYIHVHSPFISNSIGNNVFINKRGFCISKTDALRQLACPHAQRYGLNLEDVVRRVQEADRVQTVVFRPHLAIAHAAMDRNPRISISFGVYPDGIDWDAENHEVRLVAMVICAQDTYKTWADYRRRFAKIFRSNKRLVLDLIEAGSADNFIKLLKSAEITI